MNKKAQKPMVGVIGGSGFYELTFLQRADLRAVPTPFGDVIGLTTGVIGDQPIAFIPRHGSAHRLPPHKINYRANIWAMRDVGVEKIISLNAVGGIAENCPPNTLVVPDQIIDYTYGREHTFADLLTPDINHIDFTEPFDTVLRNALIKVLSGSGISWVGEGTYACMQGPRLETAAEIRKLKADGCTLVGMTAMPEAALARELNIPYAALCTVVNWAAGIDPQPITMAEISAVLERANGNVMQLLQALMPALAE